MNKKTEQNIADALIHIKPYIWRVETPELFEMCKRCDAFCGQEHDFSECEDRPCFRNWLALVYLDWYNSY